MKLKNYLSLIASIFLLCLVLAPTIQAAGIVSANIFYEHTTERTDTITTGESVYIEMFGDGVIQNIKTAKLDINNTKTGQLTNIFTENNVNKVFWSKINYLIEQQKHYGSEGNYTLRLTITANNGEQATSELTLIVESQTTPYTNPPVLNSIGNKQINENELLEFTISATDIDGDTLTYSVSGLPSGATFNSNTFVWTPDYTQSGTYDVTFTVSDGTDTDSETITITVDDITVGNTAPIITTTAVTQVYENQAYSYDVDATDPDGDTLTYSLTQPTWLSIDSTTGLITGTAPSVNQDTDYTVNIEVSDGNGGTDTQTYTLTVKNKGDKDNKKTTTNYHQSNYEEELYLDQFKNSNVIYLEDDDHPEDEMTWFQKFIEWLKKIFGFN